MKIHYITTRIITTILLFFTLANVVFAQVTPSTKALHKAQMKKEIARDKIIFSFSNTSRETQSNFQNFESKESLGLVIAKIDPKSNKMTVAFKKDVTEKNFLSFF